MNYHGDNCIARLTVRVFQRREPATPANHTKGEHHHGKQTDAYHLTIAGANPHEIASNMGEPDSPFYDDVARPGVSQHIIVDGQLVGGIVEVWADEHLTPAQEQALAACPHVIDVRHVYP